MGQSLENKIYQNGYKKKQEVGMVMYLLEELNS